VPTAALYRVFGVNRFTSTLWPFACSLLTITLVFAAGRRLGGTRAGGFAALLLATNPLQVCHSMLLLPDIVVSLFLFASASALSKARRAGAPYRTWAAGLLVAGLFYCAFLTKLTAIWILPFFAILMVRDGDQVKAGDTIARKPRESSKTKDIVGGLPRVAELFEVRKPKELAVVSEIDGIVSFGAETKGKRKIVVTPETGETKEYLIPKGKHITVHEGDFVEAGELMTEGYPELHDILKIKGEKHLAKYLVDEIQDVYRFQGVKINDKHIEIIVRQMLKKVTITDPGETGFLNGEQADKMKFMDENAKAVAEGRKPAMAEPLVLGITQASLSTDSFVSAASFQETTKVLTEAALMGKHDPLRGLKENVIVGRLIPAGTGYRRYMDIGIDVPEQPERPDKFLEELEEEPILIENNTRATLL